MKTSLNKSSVVSNTIEPGKVFFQPKLVINKPNHIYEQEADEVSERIMRMPAGDENLFFKPSCLSTVQRKCTECEEEEKIQRKEINAGDFSPGNDFESYTGKLNSGGNFLSKETRNVFEPIFGYDFSNVRIHNDPAAVQSAKSINALAYTTGSNIVFNQNQHAPETDSGKRLLAHELTHVIQQDGHSGVTNIQKEEDKDAGAIGKEFEENFQIQTLIENGKLFDVPEIMGQEFTAECDSYSVVFKFPKAYKGLFNTNIPGYMFKGVYVNLEAHYHDKSESGRCSPLRLLQVLRYFKEDETGDTVTTEPTSPVNKILSGWGKGDPSEGWFVDTLKTNPFYTSSAWGMEGKEGTENSPAILWDIPANIDTRNHGKEFYTCAVCENEFSKQRSIAACIKWGYFIDENLNVNFYPSVPEANCNVPQVVIDATQRWDSLEGVQPTGITF